MIKSLFWNASQKRLRALWRLLIFFGIIGVIANPLVLLLDAIDNQLLEESLRNVLVAIAFFVALWIGAKYIDRRPLKDFGLHLSRRWWREFGVGFAIGGLIMSFFFLIGYAMGWIEIRNFLYTGIAAPFVLVVLGQIGRYAAGSFFEEVMTRSYLLRIIAEGITGTHANRKQALLISWGVTSLIFGALHLVNPNATLLGALNISLLGILFGMGMVYTGRLALPIGLHMAWNIFQNVIFGMPNSGKPAIAAVLVTESVGPEILTGGSFGPEGSLLSLGAILLGIVLVWFWLRRVYGKPTLYLALTNPPISHLKPT